MNMETKTRFFELKGRNSFGFWAGCVYTFSPFGYLGKMLLFNIFTSPIEEYVNEYSINKK